MEKINQEYLKTLAKQLMFELNQEELDQLEAEFNTLIEQMDLLDAVDTTNVEPFIYPLSTPRSYLREDVVENVTPLKDVLANTKKQENGYIVVPKVVK